MTAEEVVTTLMRLARQDSGLPEADREVLFFAHCYFSANWDAIEEVLSSSTEEPGKTE